MELRGVISRCDTSLTACPNTGSVEQAATVRIRVDRVEQGGRGAAENPARKSILPQLSWSTADRFSAFLLQVQES